MIEPLQVHLVFLVLRPGFLTSARLRSNPGATAKSIVQTVRECNGPYDGEALQGLALE